MWSIFFKLESIKEHPAHAELWITVVQLSKDEQRAAELSERVKAAESEISNQRNALDARHADLIAAQTELKEKVSAMNLTTPPTEYRINLAIDHELSSLHVSDSAGAYYVPHPAICMSGRMDQNVSPRHEGVILCPPCHVNYSLAWQNLCKSSSKCVTCSFCSGGTSCKGGQEPRCSNH